MIVCAVSLFSSGQMQRTVFYIFPSFQQWLSMTWVKSCINIVAEKSRCDCTNYAHILILSLMQHTHSNCLLYHRLTGLAQALVLDLSENVVEVGGPFQDQKIFNHHWERRLVGWGPKITLPISQYPRKIKHWQANGLAMRPMTRCQTLQTIN